MWNCFERPLLCVYRCLFLSDPEQLTGSGRVVRSWWYRFGTKVLLQSFWIWRQAPLSYRFWFSYRILVVLVEIRTNYLPGFPVSLILMFSSNSFRIVTIFVCRPIPCRWRPWLLHKISKFASGLSWLTYIDFRISSWDIMMKLLPGSLGLVRIMRDSYTPGGRAWNREFNQKLNINEPGEPGSIPTMVSTRIP